MQDYFEVGEITTTHGLKGEVKDFVTSDDPKRFERLKDVYRLDKGTEQALEIESVRYVKNVSLVKFRGLDRIEDVQNMRGCKLYIRRGMADPLSEGEYYISDLYDCPVYLEDGSLFGVVADVIRTGANDVLDVRREGKPAVLIPVIRDCIIAMQPAEQKIVIHLIKGLVEE